MIVPVSVLLFTRQAVLGFHVPFVVFVFIKLFHVSSFVSFKDMRNHYAAFRSDSLSTNEERRYRQIIFASFQEISGFLNSTICTSPQWWLVAL